MKTKVDCLFEIHGNEADRDIKVAPSAMSRLKSMYQRRIGGISQESRSNRALLTSDVSTSVLKRD